MWGLIAEQTVNGIVTGSIYAIVAVGMTMTFGVLRAINFAHGEYYMLGTFGAWFVVEKFDAHYGISVLAGIIFTAAVGAIIGRLVMQRMIAAPFQSGVLATLGVSLILQNVVILAFGGGYKFFNAGYIEPVELLGMTLAQQRLLIVAAAILVFAALELLVNFTWLGRSMRAVAQNIDCCQVVGVDVPQVVLSTFIIGTVLAALSGVLTAPINVTVYGGMGEMITLKTFAIIVIGGMGNVRGTLFAGWILGIVESFVAGYVGLQFRDAVGFVALIVILMWRPAGLFSLRSRY
jgi:branched-chain amino acid transport system permease protein